MRIPTEHFEHIPVYTLSPSPMSPGSKAQIFAYEKYVTMSVFFGGIKSAFFLEIL